MRENKKLSRRRLRQVLISGGVATAIVALLTAATWGRDIPILQPKGTIADQQYVLIMITLSLGVLVVVPVFVLLFVIAWKYRASNTKAHYAPELEGDTKLEVLWWGIPCLIIVVLAGITYVSTHALDPYKPIESDVTPVKVQVVSLEWKWLFMYPEHNVATLNFMNIPKDTPIELSLTSDAPMNSFWVPALAGQVYTMTGMQTKLHLMANAIGTYNGTSANISGEGFADMTFKVNVMNETEFVQWARRAAHSPALLTSETYATLREPSKNVPDATFLLKKTTLFHDIMMKYMTPESSDGHTHDGHKTDTMEHMHTEGMDR